MALLTRTPVLGLQRAEADLHGELAAVLAQAVELATRAHRPHPRRGEEAAAVSPACAAEPLGHQDLDLPPQQLLAGVAEERLGLGVDQDDPAGRVDDHHRVGGRLQEPAEFRLRPLAPGDVVVDLQERIRAGPARPAGGPSGSPSPSDRRRAGYGPAPLPNSPRG